MKHINMAANLELINVEADNIYINHCALWDNACTVHAERYITDTQACLPCSENRMYWPDTYGSISVCILIISALYHDIVLSTYLKKTERHLLIPLCTKLERFANKVQTSWVSVPTGTLKATNATHCDAKRRTPSLHTARVVKSHYDELD
jgi:hypothetical protein